jgi:hypothetical protein
VWHVLVTEPTGLLMALTVVLVGAALCFILWAPMSAPARSLAPFTPTAPCANLPLNSTALTACAFENGVLGSFSTFVVVGILAFIRWPLNWIMNAILPRLAPTAGHGLAALIAVLMFGVTWSGSHFRTPNQPALLPQPVFVAVIGLFTFATLHWGPPVLRVLDPALRVRDRIPLWVRMVLGALLPVLFGLFVLNRLGGSVPNPPPIVVGRNEQISTLFALAASFILMAPRLEPFPDLGELIDPEDLDETSPRA